MKSEQETKGVESADAAASAERDWTKSAEYKVLPLRELVSGLHEEPDEHNTPATGANVPGSKAVSRSLDLQLRRIESRLRDIDEFLDGVAICDEDTGDLRAAELAAGELRELVDELDSSLNVWGRNFNCGRIVELSDEGLAAFRSVAGHLPIPWNVSPFAIHHMVEVTLQFLAVQPALVDIVRAFDERQSAALRELVTNARVEMLGVAPTPRAAAGEPVGDVDKLPAEEPAREDTAAATEPPDAGSFDAKIFGAALGRHLGVAILEEIDRGLARIGFWDRSNRRGVPKFGVSVPKVKSGAPKPMPKSPPRRAGA